VLFRSPQQRVLSISQRFPWFGSLSSRENSLAAAADAAVMTVRDQELRSENEVRAAWYELTFIAGQREVLTRTLLLANENEIVARARYETGDGSYSSLLNIQMEVGRLAARLEGLTDQIIIVTTQLNIAAGLEIHHTSPQTFAFQTETLLVELPTSAELTTAMWRLSPVLAAMRYQERSRRHGVEAAGRRSYPDFTLGVDYIMTGAASAPNVVDSGKDPVIARIGVSIPLWGGAADAEQKSSVGQLHEASAIVADTRQRLAGQLETALFKWREAGRNRDLYGVSLLPRSQQNLHVVKANYQAGAVHFDELQDAREDHLGLELALLRANSDRMMAMNDIAALVGVTLDQLIHVSLDSLDPVLEDE